MRTIARLLPLFLLAAMIGLVGQARAGVIHLEGGEQPITLPSDPTIVEREQRRADSGDLAGATQELAVYVAGHPDERGPMILLGDFYYRGRVLGKAEATYLAALKLGDLREIHDRLGGVYTLEGRYDDAIRQFRASLPLSGGFIHLVALHRMRGDLEAFEAQTKSDADNHPNDPDYALDLALTYDVEGRSDDALAAYHRVVDLDPNSPAGYNGIGSILISQERYRDAIPPLQKALSLQPQFVAALNNLGDAYVELHDAVSAHRYLDEALTLEPGNASVLVNLGVLQDTAGNHSAALDDYRRAIANDPFQIEAYYDMAADYDAQGQHELAQAVTLKGLAIDAGDGILHFNLAVIDDELGLHQDALKEYRTAAQLRNPEAARLAKIALSRMEKNAAPTSAR